MQTFEVQGGDWVRHEKTGEERLVIEYSRHHKELTFCGSNRWETARGWIPTGRSARVTNWPSRYIVAGRNVIKVEG